MFKDRILIQKIQEENLVYEEMLINNRRIEIAADVMLLEDIRGCKRRELRVVQEMEKQLKKLWENDGVIYRNGRIYILNSQEIRDRILHDHHYSPDVGHPRIHQMLELVKRTFWWLMIKTDVKHYVKGCKQCQKNKSIRKPEHVPLNPLPIPENPWQEISIDMIGPLPKSEDQDAIIVIVDRFSKMIHLIPTTTSLSSLGLAEIHKKEIWRIHGIPRRIISDRGPQFASKFMKELCNALGIKRNLSTAYHPQTDSQTERINQEIETYLRSFINY
jgi:ribosomal protein L36